MLRDLTPKARRPRSQTIIHLSKGAQKSRCDIGSSPGIGGASLGSAFEELFTVVKQ
jgi:hypothetical protein